MPHHYMLSSEALYRAARAERARKLRPIVVTTLVIVLLVMAARFTMQAGYKLCLIPLDKCLSLPDVPARDVVFYIGGLIQVGGEVIE